MLDIGTTIKIIREPPYPEYNVKVGDIDVITYAAKTLKYSVYIPGKYNHNRDKDITYGNPGDFWIRKMMLGFMILRLEIELWLLVIKVNLNGKLV